MLALVALASALIADAPAGPPPTPTTSVADAYAAARAAAAPSSAGQLRLAYWCEGRGLTVERGRHLALAVLADPTNAAARGLLGLIARDGRWVRPDDVAREQGSLPAAAALLAEYDRRRSATPYNAEAQHSLGVWAVDRGLKDQARAHFTAAVRLDPDREVSWKRLGHVRRDGRWVTEAVAHAARAEAQAQEVADRQWRPILERARGLLAQPGRRDEAEAVLAGVTDPRAVPAIGRVFGKHEADQPRAVQLLGQVHSAAASRALAYLAVFGESSTARRAAAETLRRRDAREYADYLIGSLRDRVKYQITPIAGPNSKGILHVEGADHNLDRIYAPGGPQYRASDRFDFAPGVGPVVHRREGAVATDWVYLRDHRWGQFPAIDAVMDQSLALTGARATTRFRFAVSGQATYSVRQLDAEARRAAEHAQRQLLGDARTLDRRNAAVDRSNDRFLAVLQASTGLAHPGDRKAWSDWYVDLVGYRSSGDRPRTTVVEQVPLDYQPQYRPLAVAVADDPAILGYDRISCFVAGTPVRTLQGPRAIETLEVGDVVLTQNTATGALGYRPIVATHHNPPGSTFRINLGTDEVVASDFHRFWVAGRGWVMARDLRADDRVRTLGGVLPVEAISPGQVVPLFNLDVADDATFFVGSSAALVHDNTLPDPRLVPFDLPAAAAGVEAR